MQSSRRLGLSLATAFLFLCGCGNHGNSVQAPTGLTYGAGTAVYTNGVAVNPDTPTSSGGAVAAYSVSPALPAGLTLNSGSGVISGTPTAVTPIASYTVTATGVAGSTTTSISVTVNDQPPSAFSYAAGTATYVSGTPITPNSPTNSGGTVVSYSVAPVLPGGLSLSAATGAINGTPAAVTPQAKYTITAVNSGGSATAAVFITVNSGAANLLAAPAGLSYEFGNATYTVGVSIPANVPISTGGVPLPYTSPSGIPSQRTVFIPRFRRGCASTVSRFFPSATCLRGLSAERPRRHRRQPPTR
ncbi:MAG: putative Ig domain-containing protein [Terracidiphilus sp.]